MATAPRYDGQHERAVRAVRAARPTAWERRDQPVTQAQVDWARHSRKVARQSAQPTPDTYANLPTGAIIPADYDPRDRRLFRVVRPATALPPETEEIARIGDFRAWLRMLAHDDSDTPVGFTGDPHGDPVATFLRATRSERNYAAVCVRAGDGVAHGASFLVWRHASLGGLPVGAPSGMGFCDAGLSAAIDWVDGAGLTASGKPRLLTAGEVAAMLDTMSRVWPSPDGGQASQARAGATFIAQAAWMGQRESRRPGIANRPAGR